MKFQATSIAGAAALFASVIAFGPIPSANAAQDQDNHLSATSPKDQHQSATSPKDKQKSATDAQEEHQPAMDVTVVGCVVRETDYRKAHHSGIGGPMGTGIGIGNEYVLINASRIEPGRPAPVIKDCGSDYGGDAYELTGGGEGQAKPFVGRIAQISGTLKRAEITKETRGTDHPQPTGGKDPLDQDLKLFEINVASVGDYVPPVAHVAPPAPAPQAAFEPPAPAPEPQVAPEPEPEPIATTGRETLPATAGSMPLVALIGAFFVAAAVTIQLIRSISNSRL